jgi:preprotein translocase subunit SecF
MFIIRYRKLFIAITAVIVALSIGSLLVFGLTFGIEFTGGTLLEVSYPDGRPDKEVVETELATLELGATSLRPTNATGYLLRTRDLTEEEHQRVIEALSLGGEANVVEERLNTVGPIIGEELRNKAFVSIGIVLILIVIYVAFAFRSVTTSEDERKNKNADHEEGVGSFTYGFITIMTLTHDILVPIGVFAALGYFAGAEADVLFVTALLTILGYSVNDTIVIFDRIRENIVRARERKEQTPFPELVGRSLEETYARSINTSVTVLIVVLALLVFGSEATMLFALTLTLGVIAGAYSSMFLAAPLLVYLTERKANKA